MADTNFNYKEELEFVLSKFKIIKSDICLVGSIALSIRGIRDHGDIDFCAVGKNRQLLVQDKHGNYLTENVNVVVDKYERLLGITDHELIYDDKYHDIVDGFKMIKLEIEFSAKIARGWPKDLADIPLIEKYIINSANWNWDLVSGKTIDKEARIKKENKSFVYFNKGKQLLAYLKKALKNPRLLRSKIKERVRKNTFSLKKSAKPTSNLKDQLIVKMPTAALLGGQFIDNEFSRYDLLLRYLTVKSIAEGRDDYLQEYRLMQQARVKKDTEVNIKSLVESINEKGFMTRYPIPINREGLLIQGAHRLACALYYDIREIPVSILPDLKKIYYGRKWFEDINFDQDLLTKLDETKDMLFRKFGVWFSVILWPPAKDWFDEIEEWLKNKYIVKQEAEIDLGSKFADFTREVYAIDDIEKWKVERKIHAMNKYDPIIRSYAVEINHPNFREKKRTGSYLSDEGAKLRAFIRNSYNNKVANNIYDIICHTGDNHEHNRKIFEIIDAYTIDINKQRKIVSQKSVR